MYFTNCYFGTLSPLSLSLALSRTHELALRRTLPLPHFISTLDKPPPSFFISRCSLDCVVFFFLRPSSLSLSLETLSLETLSLSLSLSLSRLSRDSLETLSLSRLSTLTPSLSLSFETLSRDSLSRSLETLSLCLSVSLSRYSPSLSRYSPSLPPSLAVSLSLALLYELCFSSS